MYIAISGNIGSGKTTLTEILANKKGFVPFYEDVSNPYLDDFYKDMSRWAFNLQIAFLGKKASQLEVISKCHENIVQDRTIYEEANIFVKNLANMGLLTTRDYNAYIDVFNLIQKDLIQPDLIVYLKASTETLIGQIYKRGRIFEMDIDVNYIERLNLLYEHWINEIYTGRVLTIDMDNRDFVMYPEIADEIIKEIELFI